MMTAAQTSSYTITIMACGLLDTLLAFCCKSVSECVAQNVSGVFLESTTEFTVDARSVVPRGGKVKAFVTAPSGTRTEALVNNNNDGTYKCMYTPYEQGMSPTRRYIVAHTDYLYY